MTQTKVATVFGGTGFVGRQIVRELAARGYIIKVATRIPESAYFLKPCGAVGQVVPVACDYADEASIRETVAGSDYVVNCIGILFEKGRKNKFKKVHVETPASIAKACADEKVSRFVHVSALGCDIGMSKYAKSKLEGEREVIAAFPKATILRPSVIFGEDDNFFNMFAELARYLPFLPLIGGGTTKLQPVFVGDVADAVIAAVIDSGASYEGNVYELGGPRVLTLKEVYELLFKYTERPRKLIPLPFSVAKLEATFLSFAPKPILTPDQVESLKTDVIVSDSAFSFSDLGIVPKSMDLILPAYLGHYKSGGRFSDTQSA